MRRVPALSDADRRAARAAALDARRRRAQVKELLRSGELSMADVLTLADDDAVVAHIRVFDVLRCLPRVGRVRAAGIMDEFQIAPSRRLRGLGEKQRAHLLEEAHQAWR